MGVAAKRRMSIAEAINSMPSPLAKLVLSGGWTWLGFWAVKGVKLCQASWSSSQVDQEAVKASELFHKLDDNNSKTVCISEFKSALADKEKFPKLARFSEHAFDAFLKGVEKKGGEFTEEEFIPAWKAAKAELIKKSADL